MKNLDLIFDGRLPFILNTIGETGREHTVCRDPGPAWNQFIWVKEGEGKFDIAGSSHIIGAGQGMFMKNGIPHRYSPKSDVFHTSWCTFFAAPSLVEYCIGDKPYIIFDVPDFLEKETEMLTALARSSASTLELSSAGYAYVTSLFAAITTNTDSVISNVNEYLENNCHLPLTLDEISDAVGLNRFSLCRYFKKHHIRSVMDELLHIRIKKAKRLLRYSHENIESVGKLCGFDSPSYFSMRFREECGCSPSEYKKMRY